MYIQATGFDLDDVEDRGFPPFMKSSTAIFEEPGCERSIVYRKKTVGRRRVYISDLRSLDHVLMHAFRGRRTREQDERTCP
jgi:hypothetical protein